MDHNHNNVTKKNYIFTSPAIWPMIEYELDIAQRLLDQNKEVFWVRCEGDDSFCPANINKKKRICVECISKSNNAIKWIGKRNNFHILKKKIDLSSSQNKILQNLKLNFYNTNELKSDDIILDDWRNIVLSTLQTVEKKFFIKINLSKKINNSILKNLVETFFFSKNYLDKDNIAEVYIFNGRISNYRPVMRICQNKKILMFTYEFPYQGYKRYFLLKGNYSHDLIYKSDYFMSFYNNHYFNNDKKISLGKKWLLNRIYGRVKMGAEENFKKNQIVKKIPEFIKTTDRVKILINLSTEWEIGGVIENKRYFFKNQYDSVLQILNFFNDNDKFLFIIKIHPQYKNFETELADEYKKFSSLKNTKVILPEDDYDVYEMINNSDIIITFISMTGAESAFLNKRVICIGPSSYETFNLSSNPKSSNEFFDLLINFKKGGGNYDYNQAKINACKWAFSRSWCGTKPKYIYKDRLNNLLMLKDGKKKKIKSNIIYRMYNNFFKIYFLIRYLILKRDINYSKYKNIFSVFKNDVY